MVMVKFGNDEYGMDNYLNSNLMDLSNDVRNKDFDGMIIVCGRERLGKCCPAGTKVMIVNGEWKNIEDIKIGDEVLSPQLDGSYIYAKVSEVHNWFSSDIYDIYELHRQKKKLYSCAGNHLIPINEKRNGKWEVQNYEAQELAKKSNNIKTLKIKERKIKIKKFHYDKMSIRLEKQAEGKQVYGFTLDSPSGLYITDNWCVTHNSTIAFQMACCLDPTFNLSRVCFTADQFIDAVKNAEKFQAIVFDEAFGYLSSSSSLSKFNIALRKVMTEMGFKNLFIIICIPSFFTLQWYPAVHRSNCLIRVHERGHLGFYTYDQKKKLYALGKKFHDYCLPPSFVGKFSKFFPFERSLYDKKKEQSIFTETAYTPSTIMKKLIMQRNILIKKMIEKSRLFVSIANDINRGREVDPIKKAGLKVTDLDIAEWLQITQDQVARIVTDYPTNNKEVVKMTPEYCKETAITQ
jgi:hypothetical protein